MARDILDEISDAAKRRERKTAASIIAERDDEPVLRGSGNSGMARLGDMAREQQRNQSMESAAGFAKSNPGLNEAELRFKVCSIYGLTPNDANAVIKRARKQ